MSKLKDYLFRDTETDEYYFVECKNQGECREILEKNGLEETAKLVGVYSPEQADILGYDTYWLKGVFKMILDLILILSLMFVIGNLYFDFEMAFEKSDWKSMIKKGVSLLAIGFIFFNLWWVREGATPLRAPGHSQFVYNLIFKKVLTFGIKNAII